MRAMFFSASRCRPGGILGNRFSALSPPKIRIISHERFEKMLAEPFLSRALFQQATALKLFKIGGPRKPQPAVEAVNFYRVLVNSDRLCPYDQHGAETNSVSTPRSSCTPFCVQLGVSGVKVNRTPSAPAPP